MGKAERVTPTCQCVDGSSGQCDRARHCERAEQASYLHVTSFVSAFRANRRATLICTRIEVGSLMRLGVTSMTFAVESSLWGLSLLRLKIQSPRDFIGTGNQAGTAASPCDWAS